MIPKAMVPIQFVLFSNCSTRHKELETRLIENRDDKLTRASSTLQHPQHHQCSVRLLESQPDARSHVHDKYK